MRLLLIEFYEKGWPDDVQREAERGIDVAILNAVVMVLPRSQSYGAAEDGLDKEEKWTMARRHWVAVLAFFGFANIYAMRANLSVAIVEMTTGSDRTINGTQQHVPGEFSNWSPTTQGVILGSFFYGYILTQIPGGYLAHNYGAKSVFVGGVFGTAIFTLLTPPLAKLGYIPLIAARFMEGLLEGVTYPAMHVIWSHWAPTLEKTKLATFGFSGSYFGTVIAMPISAYIGERYGWQYIFYFFGFVAILWGYLWTNRVQDYPAMDPDITTDELTLLQRDAVNQNQYLVPWKEILRSGPVWAAIAAHTCQNWGFYTMLTQLPRILNDLAGNYEMEKAGFIAGLPYLIMGGTLIWGGQLADYLRKERNVDTLTVRRRFCASGFILQSVFLVLASIARTPAFLVGYLSLSIGFGGICWAGFSVNHLDLAPQYAGHLMGVSNTVATLPGMIAPIITGMIVQNGTAAEWNVIFYSTSIIYAIGAAIFWKFASGDLQSWAGDHTPFIGDIQ